MVKDLMAKLNSFLVQKKEFLFFCTRTESHFLALIGHKKGRPGRAAFSYGVFSSGHLFDPVIPFLNYAPGFAAPLSAPARLPSAAPPGIRSARALRTATMACLCDRHNCSATAATGNCPAAG